VALAGDPDQAPFSDLVHRYRAARRTAAVRVSLGSDPEKTDGVFYFEEGELVAARLGGADGREAVHQALRLGRCRWREEVGARPTRAGSKDEWRRIVLEELVGLDEEAARRALERTPAQLASAVSGGAPQAPPPAPPRDPSGGAPRSPVPPVPPRKGGRGALLALAFGALVILCGVAAWLLLGTRPPPLEPTTPRAAAPASAPVVASAAPAAPPVRGVAPGELKLGMVASFTGSNKERGRAMRMGWDAAIAAVNAQGGIHGRRVTLVALDDGYDPARTLPAMKQLVEGDQVFAVVGNVGTATAAKAVPYCAERKVIFYGPLSGADLLRRSPPDRYVFNFRASLGEEAAAAVRWLVDVRRVEAKKIAVLAQEDEFGESGWRGAARQLGSYGVAAKDVLRIGYARNTADVRAATEALRKKAGAIDAVVMVATYKPAATFVRKVKDAGLSPLFTTVSADSTGLSEELAESGPSYTEGVLLTQVVPVPTSRASTVLRFRDELEKAAPGEKPGSTALEAWIGAQLFFEALRRAGPDVDTEKLVGALEALGGLDLGLGGAFSFGPADHQASDRVWGWELEPDGGWKQVDLQ
jgi:branched-chain amino acid transport system substrate-binding protein